MRALGLDLGTRRIGVAISDSDGLLATPIDTVVRSKTRAGDHLAIAALVEEWGAEVAVVGLPLSLDGRVGPAAQGVLDEVPELAEAIGVPVETVDERFTTVTADRHLRATGVRGRARTKVVDRTSAAVLLQAWLDQRRADRG
ncbi:MAG TPA: Holliday junction resolvase RuvX [Acidimicrobiales bacterium]|nr:Holliday junction resolvase RuvX [Acidimicrobiales bacterium]